MLRVWNLSLVLATFCLTILGTFLTRSGVVNSVHAFTQSTHRAVAARLPRRRRRSPASRSIAWRADKLHAPGRIDSPVSREAAFLANNLLFTGLAFVVLLGTVFPLVAEALRGNQLSVGEPYFARMTTPIGLGAALPHGGRARAAVARRERRGAPAPAARPRVRRASSVMLLTLVFLDPHAGHRPRVRARDVRDRRDLPGDRRSRCAAGAPPTSAGWLKSFDRHGARQPAPLRRVHRAHRRDLHRGRARRRRARSARSARCGSGAASRRRSAGYKVTFVGTRDVEHRPEDVASRPTSKLQQGRPEPRHVRAGGLDVPEQPARRSARRRCAPGSSRTCTSRSSRRRTSKGRVTVGIAVNSMTLWVWIGGGLMALGTIVAIGPTRAPPAPGPRRRAARRRRRPSRSASEPAARRRGGGVKHPFRWIALAVGAGRLRPRGRARADGQQRPARGGRTRAGWSGKRAPAFSVVGARRQADHVGEPRGQDRARELLELVVHPVPPGARRARDLVRASTATTRRVVLLGIVREDSQAARSRSYVKDNERHVAGRRSTRAAKAALDFGTRGQPETYAIGPDGVVAASKFGPGDARRPRPDGGVRAGDGLSRAALAALDRARRARGRRARYAAWPRGGDESRRRAHPAHRLGAALRRLREPLGRRQRDVDRAGDPRRHRGRDRARRERRRDPPGLRRPLRRDRCC